ncbi:MAG TPA: redoxin domain-containing protein [Candidatus Diapherotrites archaeon]|uniref:Redoxin domain-containing protein n=1 Tax=Candidatus Iainarchaeum sp. TaxID=3101447 RepID=A0A7J4JEU2_9ARCH|nr:redoxin domain-containing protein [Candidatus Diapherotrites archaeon]HIH16291.1 redoxin domain-containing protein [Candidatus Diapherotrites archaeon]
MGEPENGSEWVGQEAPELVCSGQWLNSKPLTLQGLKGTVVLLDFLSYSCVNCIRTFPFLNQWYERYREQGLEIIGIHTPEFEFEKDAGNLEAALKTHGLRFPVMQDNDYLTWKAFHNNYWPRKFLLDRTGKIVYDHVGEGAYGETEKKMRELLEVKGRGLTGKPAGQSLFAGLSEPLTGELYVGYARGIIGNIEGYEPDHEIEYAEPEYREDGIVYVKGTWMSRAQYMHHSRDTQGRNDFAWVRYTGRSANAVMGPAYGKRFTVFLEVDGHPLKKSEAGLDVSFDERGRSFVEVRQPRMYGLVGGGMPLGGHELKLVCDSREFCLYTFTFGL